MSSLKAAAVVIAWIVVSPALGGAVGAATSTKSTSTPAKPHAMVLPFMADDYTRAVAEARARKVPLFVEAWAPW